MKKYLLFFPVCLLIIGLLFFQKPERPTERILGNVVDLAMDDGLPYVGIQTDSGDGMCIYYRSADDFAELLSLGNRVEVLYETIPYPTDIRHFAVAVTVLE